MAHGIGVLRTGTLEWRHQECAQQHGTKHEVLHLDTRRMRHGLWVEGDVILLARAGCRKPPAARGAGAASQRGTAGARSAAP
ncbi:MAG TPA: hypothetical protein PLO34_03475, partial [Pseudoxanthomonas sp.]|nr:hypothetical protein [Pseudoxanthomonas sp.]